MRQNSKKKVMGFTLVELLIVVAIIGVLATIGVPTFRKMVQKAKKSEAKVALGGLYTAENAFFAEYGTYGNNLPKIGFDLDGNTTGRIYVIGFMDGSCVADSTDMPALANNAGIALNASFPSYYTSGVIGAGNKLYTTTKAPAANCLSTTSVTTAAGTDFLAVANGVIAPNISLSAPGAGNVDQWSIDRMHNLVNVNDGVKN